MTTTRQAVLGLSAVIAVTLSAVAAPARAGDAGLIFGAVVGGGAGALIGQSIGGRDGAIIGGAIGAAAGAAAADRHHATVHASPVVVHSQPVYVHSQPVYVHSQPVYVYPQPVYVQPQRIYLQPQPVVVYGSTFHGWSPNIVSVTIGGQSPGHWVPPGHASGHPGQRKAKGHARQDHPHGHRAFQPDRHAQGYGHDRGPGRGPGQQRGYGH
jgi:hypothetical protein